MKNIPLVNRHRAKTLFFAILIFATGILTGLLIYGFNDTPSELADIEVELIEARSELNEYKIEHIKSAADYFVLAMRNHDTEQVLQLLHPGGIRAEVKSERNETGSLKKFFNIATCVSECQHDLRSTHTYKTELPNGDDGYVFIFNPIKTLNDYDLSNEFCVVTASFDNQWHIYDITNRVNHTDNACHSLYLDWKYDFQN